MGKQGYKVSKETKEEIIKRIKDDGVSVSQAAEDHGVSVASIYTWLGGTARSSVSVLEHNKLKKENEALKQLIGDITLQLSQQQKKG